jgi:hypothetical protein
MSASFDYDLILATERAIAQRHRIAWSRVDRSWVRGEALKHLRAESAKESA